MRSIFSLLLLLFSLNQSSFAQMSCAEELLACTNGCVAGGILGALVTKGNSAAATAAQSCSIDCESRNAACTRREDEAAIRQQRIDAERAAVEARRQAGERRQKERSDQQNANLNSRQMNTDQLVDRALASLEREWKLLQTFHNGIPKSNVPPPSEPKPAAILEAAKSLEDTDPLMARKLYLRLSDRTDQFGKAASTALKRFRSSPVEDEEKIRPQMLGEIPSILTTLIPRSSIRMLAALRVPSQDVIPQRILYSRNGWKEPSSGDSNKNLGGGYVYTRYFADQERGQQISIISGLVPILKIHSTPEENSKRILTDLNIEGNPYLFTVGNAFSYTTTHQVAADGLKAYKKTYGIEKYIFNCKVTKAIEKEAIIVCQRRQLQSPEGPVDPRTPENTVKLIYIPHSKVFSQIMSISNGFGEGADQWDHINQYPWEE